MSTDELAQQLHDKATRGATLSTAEQAQLEAWSAQQDREESATLAQTAPPQTLVALHAQVDAAVAQLLTVTQRIQELVAQNDALRHAIAALQRQLTQTLPTQPA